MHEQNVARAIIDANIYMVLATADEMGRPWASPVYFAHSGYATFVWVSSPDATHSRNIAVRPQVGIVVFNSHAAIGAGQGVYMSADAERVPREELDEWVGVFSRRSVANGGAMWKLEDVWSEAPFRLYRATATEYSILVKDGRADHRIVADLVARIPESRPVQPT